MKPNILKPWLTLFGLQMLVALLVFSEFLSGKFYFAYLDIGSDSYSQVTPYAMYLARAMSGEGLTGWSFQIGLGGPTTVMLGDLATWLSQLAGVAGVLPIRIYLYLLKIMLGGSFFLLFIRHYLQRWESAVISSLAYSFCGFMVINGQWDIEATAFVFYPLVLWAVSRHLRTGGVISLPVVIATSLYFGTFFVSLGIFLLFACGAFVACSDAPKATFEGWIKRIVPLTALGYVLASPYLLPVILQLMDSSRVSGGQSLIGNIISKSFSVNDWALIITEIGGVFHKDIFGVGDNYKGYFNYLEGPGFFIGITSFLILPQLWAGAKFERRAMVFAGIGFCAYMVFPVFRYAAMGFAAPYFRISTLWISILGLVLAARAVDQVLVYGVRMRLLIVGLVSFFFLMAVVIWGATIGSIWWLHVEKISALAVLSTGLLLLSNRKFVTSKRFPIALALLVVVEMATIARPSFVDGRKLVRPNLIGYEDSTSLALAFIRELDRGTFRIERDYASVFLADAMAQDYMGIKSYSLHSRGVVDFHIGVGLLPTKSEVVNYSNWLSNAGERFILSSLLGVKYFIAKSPVSWPGFSEIGEVSGLRIYRNSMALPFGIVQTQQITKDGLTRISAQRPSSATVFADATLINAVVVEQLLPGYGSAFDIDALAQSKTLSLEDQFFYPAAELQKTGLKLDHFSNTRISGRISPNSAGVLVFSIPFNSGWTLKLDGQTTPMIRANFGMLAAPVLAGAHTVELTFKTPGRRFGWILGSLGLLALILIGLNKRLQLHFIKNVLLKS